MASGSAIRGSRVGAGPMGEAERGDTAPRIWVSYWCANGHETRPSFAEEAALEAPLTCDCTRRVHDLIYPGNPPAADQERAVQDAPGVREGATIGRGRCRDPRRGAGGP